MTETEHIVGVLGRHSQKIGERTAYTFGDGADVSASLSFAQLDRLARHTAVRLSRVALPGARVLLTFPPGLEFLVGYLGCLYAGLVAVPLYPPGKRSSGTERIKAIAADCRARHCLTTEALRTTLEEALATPVPGQELSVQVLDLVADELAERWTAPAIGERTLAFLQYTSGTTGAPKGVQVSHGNLISNLRFIEQRFEHDESSMLVSWLPQFHDMGLVGCTLSPLFTGFRCHLMAPTSFVQAPLRWLEAVTRHGATTSGAPTFGYRHCVERIEDARIADLDLSSWNVAFVGAEPVSADVLDRFAQRFGAVGFRAAAFYPCYGLAESTLMVTGGKVMAGASYFRCKTSGLQQGIVEPAEDESAKVLAGNGSPQAREELQIVDPETLVACEPGRVGEVWISGPSVAQGYWNRAELTETVFRARISGDDRTFLRTGDLGLVVDGQLVITGRLKELLIVHGRNHYPEDIERTAQSVHPGMQQGRGAVFDAGDDGIYLIQEVVRTQVRTIDPEAARRAIRRAVAEEHGVKLGFIGLARPGTLPVTSSGKIRRSACLALVRAEGEREWEIAGAERASA